LELGTFGRNYRRPLGYKTLSYPAWLSSCFVKRHNFLKINFFATKIYKNVLLIVMQFSWKFELNPSRTSRIINFLIEQPDSVPSASDCCCCASLATRLAYPRNLQQ